MTESGNEKLYQENQEIVDYLRNARLFGHIPQELLNQLEPLSNIVSYPAKAEILTEGQENDRVYLLMRGEVEVYAKGESILVLKRKGDIFGEMSIISSKPCSATVVSKTPVTLFTINAKNVGKYSDIGQGDVRNFFYQVFAMILTEKLRLTTAKARQFETTSKLLEDTKVSLEQKIEEQKRAEENRLKLEARLRHSQKLEAIGTLAGGIAHDFNNLLFTMLGYITMARDDLPEDSNARRDLEESLVAGKRAKELVQQILAFSRHQDGEKKPIQITPLIKETIKFIKSSLPRSIEIQENVSDDHGIILGEPSQIHQVIMNLCTNAGYAMKKKGGTLSITVCRTRVTSDFADNQNIEVGDYLVMTVKDTGEGIKENEIDRIFDPFFTTKPVGEGSGMGLAVVHGIVKKYEGAITVESLPEKGTRFDVYLPIIPHLDNSNSVADMTSIKGNEKILIVESEETTSSLMKRVLVKSGYQVMTANRGEDALEILERSPASVDLIIVDQSMPGLSGMELSHRFADLNPDYKIILTTGYQSTISSEEATLAGIDEVLTKPMELETLSFYVQEVLSKRK